MERRKVDIEARILERIPGKINLLQNENEKREIVSGVISDLYGATPRETFMQSETMNQLTQEEEREKFIEEFFKYGLIDDFLRDPDVEDVIINALNPIYIHHSFKGLIKTDRRFVSSMYCLI